MAVILGIKTLPCKINREATKKSTLSSSKIDKYEYLTGEEILPPDQSRVIEWANYTYSPLGKALEKQTNAIEDQGKKETESLRVWKPIERKLAIKDTIPKYQLNETAKNKLERLKK